MMERLGYYIFGKYGTENKSGYSSRTRAQCPFFDQITIYMNCVDKFGQGYAMRMTSVWGQQQDEAGALREAKT